MYKQAIIVRKDLKWGKGKLAAHAAHASVGAVIKSDRNVVEEWERDGAKKVVLKIPDLKQLRATEKTAKDLKLVTFLVRDAGLTQLEKGTVTALAIGPDKEKVIDKVAGKLKLL